MIRRERIVWLRASVLMWLLVLSACKEPPDGAEPEESLGKTVAGLTVNEVAAAAGCSTTAVRGLSEQVIQVVNCLRPGMYHEIPSRANLSLGSAVFPYLEAPARDHLIAALDAHPSTTMYVTSMLRTVVAQYLLYYWYQHGLCGIGAAAQPGSSQHESGLAIDVSNYSAWVQALEAHGFTWYGAGDEVHFTYTGPGAVDLRSDGVLAFQKLWNHNHPSDRIAEDGVYGPETAQRIGKSPPDGFPLVPPCVQEDAGVADGGGVQEDAGSDALPDSGETLDGTLADASLPEDAGGPVDAEHPDVQAEGGEAHGPYKLVGSCSYARHAGSGLNLFFVLWCLTAVAGVRRLR